MADIMRKPTSTTDILLAHLIKARLVATGAGFDRTNTLIEQALCTVMREYRGADHDDAISQAAALDARVA